MTIEPYNEMNPLASYIYECCCGEKYRNLAAASVCKKCRTYSVWGYTKYVINLKTDEVVYGELPSDEEYATAAAAAEKRWAAEQAEWQLQKEEDERRWEEQEAAAKQEAARVAVEAEEERLWAIQDHLMCR